jgi:hypothetical protein
VSAVMTQEGRRARLTSRRDDTMQATLRLIARELKAHAPFTVLGALVGIAIMALVVYACVPQTVSRALFWTFHPAHVLLSAVTTSAMYRLHGKGTLWPTILVGYFGSIGIATVSDCLVPYLGEWLLHLPHRHAHIGFIEMPLLVNPLALIGIFLAYKWPRTKIPHAGHVLLSTSASLFHMTMAVGGELNPLIMGLMGVFLFLAVWIPCCTSDIVFPLLFSKGKAELELHPHH